MILYIRYFQKLIYTVTQLAHSGRLLPQPFQTIGHGVATTSVLILHSSHALLSSCIPAAGGRSRFSPFDSNQRSQ